MTLVGRTQTLRRGGRFTDDVRRLTHKFRVKCGDVCRSLAAERFELAWLAPISPYVVQRHQLKPVLAGLSVGQVADPVELRRAFSDLVGKLSQRLSRTDADAGRDAGPFRSG